MGRLLNNAIFFSLFLVCAFGAPLQAQHVVVTGKVHDTEQPGPVYHLMVVSKATGRGIFGEPDGRFTITLPRGDTLLISVPGYRLERIPVQTERDTLLLTVELHRLERTLPELEVKAPMDATEIRDELSRMELERDPLLSDPLAAIQSPISYLYARFSRFEKSKRKVAELEYRDRMNELLRELFRIYIANDIIDLKPEEFERFLLYLNLPDAFIRNASEYDLVMAVKQRYEHWKKVRTLYRDH